MGLIKTASNIFRTGYGIKIDTYCDSQDIAGNYSDVHTDIYLFSTGSTYTINASASTGGYITMDGNQQAFSGVTAGLTGNQTKLLAVKYQRIYHWSDGTRSFGVTGSFDLNVTLSGVWYGTVQVSSTAYLPTISRLSVVDSNVGFVTGETFNVSWTSFSSSYTNALDIYVNSTLCAHIHLGQGSGSINVALSDAQITSIYTKLAQATTGAMIFRISTYNSTDYTSNYLGYTDKSGTVWAQYKSTFTCPEFNIGSPILPVISCSDSRFTHTMKFETGAYSVTKTLAAGTYTPDLTIAPNNVLAASVYGQIPNTNTASCKLTLTTFFNGVQVRDTSYIWVNGRVTGSNPTFTNAFTYADTNATVTTVTANNQYIVQNQSTLVVTLTSAQKAVAQNSATMVSYIASINGETVTQAWSSSATVTFDFGTINASSNQTLSITAVDSRGNTTVCTKTVTVLKYSAPVMTPSAVRVNNFETNTNLNLNGSFDLLTISSVNKNSMLTSKYRTKQLPSGSWSVYSDFSRTTNGALYSVTQVVASLDNALAWQVEFQVSDKLSTSTIVLTVQKGSPIMFMDSENNSVGVNCFTETGYKFKVNGNTKLDGEVNRTGVERTTASKVTTIGGGGVLVYENVVGLDGAASNAGQAKITFPTSWLTAQFMLEIDIINYASTGCGKLIVNGNQTAATWNNCAATLIGNIDLSNVKFGHDGTKCCILISKSSNWAYAAISVSKVITESTTDISTGWTASFITTEAGITVAQTVSSLSVMPVGTVTMTGQSTGSSAPPGHLFCNGAAISRTAYANLYAVIGTLYGVGDGSTTFNVPDFRDRFPAGANPGGVVTDRGVKGGTATHALTENEMPNHAHGLPDGWGVGSTYTEKISFGGVANLGSLTTDTAGGAQAHNNMPPYLGINFIIKY